MRQVILKAILYIIIISLFIITVIPRDIFSFVKFPPAKVPEADEAHQEFTIAMETADEGLAKIAEEARRSIPDFVRTLQHPGPGESEFCVKYGFDADRESGFDKEYLWLSSISFRDGFYFGKIMNIPQYISYFKQGDTVPFIIDDIVDWMYQDNGKIAGGKSIKYLIEQIAEQDRNAELTRLYEKFR
ncbi:MAG: DUF2314 domain-containing protein [Treponema sp.]|jgi:uncharacterized protein YegJ (DUF2314 family)|nr:DUF2314 domain-containing protein [Treponema sp.]